MTDGSDLEWLGLERTGPGRWSFTLGPELSRLDGKFYGGTGIASTVAMMEAESGRRALWASVQFVASGTTGDRFDCQVEVLAAGRRTSQLRVTAWHGDRVVFSGLGATGESRPSPVEASFGRRPDVPPPVECAPWSPRVVLPGLPESERPGWLAIVESRVADERGTLWMKMENQPLTRAAMAFLADVVPNAVVRAAGRMGAGTSLDNTVRFGPEPDGDWILVAVEPHLISGGYVHGSAALWSEAGSLLGVASQTAGLILFD